MNNLKRMKQCPRFDFCSVPICPLDEDKDERIYLRGEPKCTLGKVYRLRYGKDLPWKGMFPREFSAWKRVQRDGLPKELRKNMGRIENLG